MVNIISRHSEINEFRSSELKRLSRVNNYGFNNYTIQYNRKSFEDIIPSIGIINKVNNYGKDENNVD